MAEQQANPTATATTAGAPSPKPKTSKAARKLMFTRGLSNNGNSTAPPVETAQDATADQPNVAAVEVDNKKPPNKRAVKLPICLGRHVINGEERSVWLKDGKPCLRTRDGNGRFMFSFSELRSENQHEEPVSGLHPETEEKQA